MDVDRAKEIYTDELIDDSFPEQEEEYGYVEVVMFGLVNRRRDFDDNLSLMSHYNNTIKAIENDPTFGPGWQVKLTDIHNGRSQTWTKTEDNTDEVEARETQRSTDEAA